MTERMDVLVIGAGPAGSAAALRLATTGRDVVLVDRARFPRSKVCGDGLTPRAIHGLQRLGVWSEVSRDATIVTELHTRDLLTGAVRLGPLPSRVRGGPEDGAVVSRTVLDDALRRAAVAAGVRFEPMAQVRMIEAVRPGGATRVSATSRRGERVFEATVVVAADGASSRLAQMTFGEKPGAVRGVALRQYWRVRAPTAFTVCIPLADDRDDVPGYGWVFPVGRDVANVGVGVVGKAGCTVRSLYRRFIDLLRRDSAPWREAVPFGPLEGGALAAGIRRERIGTGALLFAGDAAGAANPFTGEGIAQAIDGGLAVADAIASTSDSTARLAAAYWERLVDRYPQSTRSVDSLGWLVDRGRTFAREFWHGVSSETHVTTRAARRMTLDDTPGPSRPFASGRAERAWVETCRRVHARRPLLAQFIEALRDDAAPHLEETIGGLPTGVGVGQSRVEEVDVAVTMVVLVMLLAYDTTTDRPRMSTRDADALASWAGDAAALGIADLLVAELFAALARLPSPWAAALTRAVSTMLARSTRRTAAGPTRARIRVDLRDLSRWVATRVAQLVDVDASVA